MKKYGFSLVEILVVIAVIAVLAAIAFPVYNGAMRKGREATCIMNLQQISQALGQYKQDNGVFPEPDDPMSVLVSAKTLEKVLTCPQDPQEGHDTYGECYNYWGYETGTGIPHPIPSKDEAKTVYQPLANPESGKQDYWRPNTIDPDADGPDASFPGLANAAAPPTTIVTVCPHHAHDGKGVYLALRLGGNAERITKPTDDTFWALSQDAK